MNKNRDDFSQQVKDTLAKRVGYHCSNPDCQKPTIGAQEGGDRSINIGIAAHITAAAPGGPRYDSSMTPEKRRSIDNGIWLCSNCSIMIDRDEYKYTVELLKNWKKQAETFSHANIAHSAINRPSTTISSDIYNLFLLRKDLDKCLKWLSLFSESPHIVLDSNNFPLPPNWEKLLADNNSFLGTEFTVTLHEICDYISRLKVLMNEERERVKKQYPRCKSGRIADMGAVTYCNRLDDITSFLLANLTQNILDNLSQKLGKQ